MYNYHDNIVTTASIDYPLYQSQQGNYFIGQTPQMSGQNATAFSALLNPLYSKKILNMNAITITNTFSDPVIAVFYLRSAIPNALPSNLVTCTNTTLLPAPAPIGTIVYQPDISTSPADGYPIFSRVVPSETTLVVDGGQIILGQDQALSVYINNLTASSSTPSTASIRVAYGWWENCISSPCCNCS